MLFGTDNAAHQLQYKKKRMDIDSSFILRPGFFISSNDQGYQCRRRLERLPKNLFPISCVNQNGLDSNLASII
jgi:hypothetical protein